MINFKKLKAYILAKLMEELPKKLYYHGYQHTLDVYKAVLLLAKHEKVKSVDLLLLKTAALLHDTGYIVSRDNHEQHSCQIAQEVLPLFAYNTRQINQVCKLVMATRIPHTPKNLLEKILCDADLDYLGRDDFYDKGNALFDELVAYNLVQKKEDWNKTQIQFLEKHIYFTSAARQLREPQKQQYLHDLKTVVATYQAA